MILKLKFNFKLETKFKFNPGSLTLPPGSHPTNSETQLKRKLETKFKFNPLPQSPHPINFESQTQKQTQIQTQKQTPIQIEPKPQNLEQVPNFENKLGLF